MLKGYVSEIFSSFQGEGLYAGRRHVFLRMAGCNLRCRYCDTPDSLERTARCTIHHADGGKREVASPLAAPDLASLLAPFLTLPGLHALAITGGEPLVQSSFLAELLAALRPAMPVLLETNGSYPDRLAAVLPFVDIVSMDVKLPSNSGEPALWKQHAEFLGKSVEKSVYVKVPVDEDTLDDELDTAARLVGAVSRDVVLFLQPIVSLRARMQVSPGRLDCFYEIACRHVGDVRVLPQAHKTLGIR